MVRNRWFEDGPLLPIEFARQSKDGRLTLVVLEGSPLVRCLWTTFSVATVAEARDSLREREDCPDNAIDEWPAKNGKSTPIEIARWAERVGVEAVVWTALKPRFGKSEGTAPSIDEAIKYLRGLPYEKKRHAEQYIRKAPRQIDTPYRRRFEQEFGWTPI
jgi:hypothetical protein